jgi:hypothetical protein
MTDSTDIPAPEGATPRNAVEICKRRDIDVPGWVPSDCLPEVYEALKHSSCVLAVQDGQFAFWQLGSSEEQELADWLVEWLSEAIQSVAGDS